MPKLAKVRDDDGMLIFECPGCNESHFVRVAKHANPEVREPVWTWNGDVDKPTVNPSLKISTSVEGKRTTQCHFFLRDGNFHFCNDCRHELAGKTVPMSDWDKEDPYA
jgi:hypothetical protein